MSVVYIISGPQGGGKTSVSKKLAEIIPKSVLVEGDVPFLALQFVETVSWEKRLSLSWQNILCSTRIYLQNGLDVVIDFVVEDELQWFCKELADLNPQTKYAVLIAEKSTLKSRLHGRGHPDLIGRSLVLLKQLSSDPGNKKFLIDTTHKQIEEIALDIKVSDEYLVNNQFTNY